MLHLRLAVLAVLASLAIGCFDGTLPPATSLADPSNPAAPEAPFSRPPRTLAAPALPPSAAPLADAVYVCPMHANVAQEAPGACPICGMTLVPRPKAEPGHDHQGHGGAK